MTSIQGARNARRSGIGGLLVMVGAVVLGSVVTVPTSAASTLAAGDLAQYVNPFVGTQPGAPDQGTGGGAGNDFPGADVPFGMVQWSPDTVTQQHGGYFYQDNRIRGFSLTHLSGAGCDTYQDVPFMPYAGEVMDSPATDPTRYVATFAHTDEKATPGYYGVQLVNGVKVELTATERTGSGRFSYPAGKTATLLVDTSGSINGTDDAQINIGKDSISGWAASGRFCGADDHYRVYFTATFDRPFVSVGTWRGNTVTPGKVNEHGGAPPKIAAVRSATGPRLQSESLAPQDVTVPGEGTGGFVTFDTGDGGPVNVRLGLSFVSIDGAERNLAAENGGTRSFDEIATAARKTWNGRLNEIQVAGGTDEQKRIFYSSLYHAFLQPNVFSDSDRRYIGFDGRIHIVDSGHAMYTNFSGWDIYRSEIQLLSLLAPHEMSDIARSMIAYADQGGAWDRWTVANDYTGVMNGDPYPAIVATAYAFGVRDFDARHAVLSMVRGATQPTTGYVERPGLPDYLKLGYVPGAASDTLEYTSADFAVATLAHRLGDSVTYATFINRAQNWQNLENPVTGYLEPRHAGGSFPANYDPASPNGYVEGNGAQYSWMVPYDVAGLVTAFGGNAVVNRRLDTLFTELNAGTKRPYAFLSNEPTLETPWLYDFTGAPYKTQQTVRRVLSQLYNSSPAGLQGNDDLGEMGSWYVWSAMGVYPEIPGRAELTLATPLFTQVKITPPTGKTITINAPGAAENTPYTVGLEVNGQKSTRPWLPESFVTSGGTLHFMVSDRPDPNWGAAPADAPPSFRDGEIGRLSYADPARLTIPPGGARKTTIGVQDLSGSSESVSWTAHPPPGIIVTPNSGTISVPAGDKVGQQLTVSVAADIAEGNYQVPISFSGAAIAGTASNVLVAQPGSLLTAYDNVGVSPDSDTAVANYDNSGYSYSVDTLAATGVEPGGAVIVSGLRYTWPSVGTGNDDNVVAAGQTVNLPETTAGAGRLGLLGSATGGDASGTLTITYTDGTKQTAMVGFTDWTRGNGQTPSAFGNLAVAKMPYRNGTDGESQQVNTYLFATAPITLQPGKRVASVTLPALVSGGDLHVFAIAVD